MKEKSEKILHASQLNFLLPVEKEGKLHTRNTVLPDVRIEHTSIKEICWNRTINQRFQHKEICKINNQKALKKHCLHLYSL